ncbi:MAG: phosphate/phosphite/phosphonate ABC transporter substrate-binding protein [Myxococcales bacterium]
MIRLSAPFGLLCALALGCASAKPTGTAGSGGTSAPVLTIGAVPLGEQAVRTRELDALAQVLERELGGRVDLSVAADYREFSKGLAERRWDLIVVGPVLYSRAHENGYDAVAIGMRGGTFVRQGLFITRADKGISRIADLKGRKLAFVSPHSSSGFQFPFAYLFAQGLGPADYTREFVGSHDAVVKAVLEGRADAGATYDGALEDLAGDQAALLTVFARTDPIPGETFAIRADCTRLPKVREVLLGLHQREDTKALLAILHADELVAPPPGVFEAAKGIDLLVTEAAGL